MRKKGFVRGARLVHEGEEYAVLELTPLDLGTQGGRLPRASAAEREGERTSDLGEPLALSDAERAIVDLLMRGLQNVEIATIRRTSSRTVANQLQRLYRKTGVTSRVELVSALATRATPAATTASAPRADRRSGSRETPRRVAAPDSPKR